MTLYYENSSKQNLISVFSKFTQYEIQYMWLHRCSTYVSEFLFIFRLNDCWNCQSHFPDFPLPYMRKVERIRINYGMNENICLKSHLQSYITFLTSLNDWKLSTYSWNIYLGWGLSNGHAFKEIFSLCPDLYGTFSHWIYKRVTDRLSFCSQFTGKLHWLDTKSTYLCVVQQ